MNKATAFVFVFIIILFILLISVGGVFSAIRNGINYPIRVARKYFSEP
jgi:hypothetical protein